MGIWAPDDGPAPQHAVGIIPGPMANIKSAKKRVLVSARKRDRNRVVRAAVKTRILRARRLVEDAGAATHATGGSASSEDGGQAQLAVELSDAVSALDRAAERGILHPRNVARRKSRLMRQVARASALAADPEAAAAAASQAKAQAKGSGRGRKSASKKRPPTAKTNA